MLRLPPPWALLRAGHGDAELGGEGAGSKTLGFTSPSGGLETVRPQHLAELLGGNSSQRGGSLATVFLNGAVVSPCPRPRPRPRLDVRMCMCACACAWHGHVLVLVVSVWWCVVCMRAVASACACERTPTQAARRSSSAARSATPVCRAWSVGGPRRITPPPGCSRSPSLDRLHGGARMRRRSRTLALQSVLPHGPAGWRTASRRWCPRMSCATPSSRQMGVSWPRPNRWRRAVSRPRRWQRASPCSCVKAQCATHRASGAVRLRLLP